MSRRRLFEILSLLAVSLLSVVFLFSCSTTRVLKEGEYSLARAKVNVLNDKDFKEGELTPYIQQKPNSYFIFGWNPFVSVYNWANGKGGPWDRFVQKLGTAPIIYDETLVDKSVSNISRHLEYLGYYFSDVQTDIKVKKKKVYVTYNVRLGKRYVIDSISYSLPDGPIASDFLEASRNSLVKTGDYLSESRLEDESTRISSVLRNRGYFTFNKHYLYCEADTLASDGKAKLEISVKEYTRNETEKEAVPFRKFTIDKINISFPKKLKVRPDVIKGLTSIKPGDSYSEQAINNSYTRLSSLRMFSSVNIGMSAVDTSRLQCDISLLPSKLQGFKINAEVSINSSGLFGVSPKVSYYHKNIFRGGEWLNLSFMGNFQFRFSDHVNSNEFGVSGGLSFPKFLFLPYRLFHGAIPRTEINASYNYQNRPEYTRNIISTSLGFGGNVQSRFFYQIYPVQLNVVRLFNLDNDFYNSMERDPFLKNAYENHFDLGSGGTFYYTTDTDVNPKNDYWYARLQFDLAGNFLSMFKPLMQKDEDGDGMIWNTQYAQYVRAEFTIGKTWRFGKEDKQAFATRLLMGAGWAYGNSSSLPFEKHFYVGGANSMRGWQSRTLGPGRSPKDNFFTIPNQMGDMRLEANMEYRFPLFWKFYGAAFVDAGNVWTLKRPDSEISEISNISWQNLWSGMALNWGLGLRVDLDFLVLRIDWGLRLHDPALTTDRGWVNPKNWFTRDGYALHFGVGYPF